MSEKSVIKKQKKKWFQFRAFVSLLAVLTFGMAVLSGAALFMAPSGRSGHLWTFWGLSKHQWEDHHNWYCLVFVAVCLLHLVLNFRPILYYLKIIGSKAYRIRFEWLLAAGVCVLVFMGVQYHWRPFTQLIEIRSRMRHGAISSTSTTSENQEADWRQGFGQMTLSEFCRQAGLEPEAAVQILEEKGIAAHSDMTMKQIANQAGLHPSQLRQILTTP